jgi:hypothetical protein
MYQKASFVFVFVCLCTVGANSCKWKFAQRSEVNAVEIENTEVKDQGSIGFCWSYALIAMIEALSIQRNGPKAQQLNLSEEALGYLGMGWTLHDV